MNEAYKRTGHQYYGKNTGRGGRQFSKVCIGFKINFRKLRKAFKLIERERKHLQQNNV